MSKNIIGLPEGITDKDISLEDYIRYQNSIREQRTKNIIAMVLVFGSVALILTVYIFGMLFSEDKDSIVTATFGAVGTFIGLLPTMTKYFFTKEELFTNPTESTTPKLPKTS